MIARRRRRIAASMCSAATVLLLAILVLSADVSAARCQDECEADRTQCYNECNNVCPYPDECYNSCLNECDSDYDYCSYGAHNCGPWETQCYFCVGTGPEPGRITHIWYCSRSYCLTVPGKESEF